MPTYIGKDKKTGREIEFEWHGESEPTEKDMEDIFAAAEQETRSKKLKSAESQYEESGDFIGTAIAGNRGILGRPSAKKLRPFLEGGGAMLGGVLASPGVVTTPLGSGLGYAIGSGSADILEMLSGEKKPYSGLKESFVQSAKDVAAGSTYEIGGQLAGAAIPKIAKGVGYLAKPTLGRLSGAGSGAVEEAFKTSKMFKKALSGKITGEEIVDNAKNALVRIKDARAGAYQIKLNQISKMSGNIDAAPIRKELRTLMERYNVKIVPKSDGSITIDTSRTAMGKKGRKDIEDVILTLSEWGKHPDDFTPSGLDTLKRRLDDFYSESGQAKQFVTSIKNTVKKTIGDAIPEYNDMLKGYSEATQLIKDIESGLMLRKQGMTGRIVADQTLRRLTSSMKNNASLRKELVQVLGNKGGADLSGQIAGYTMRSPVPIGLSGTGPLLAGQAAYAFVNPKFWPVLAASSPRIQAEFLKVIGPAVRAAALVDKLGAKEITKQTLINLRRDNE